MGLSQQKFREIVFQLLYSYDMGQNAREDMISLITKELRVSKQIVSAAQDRVDAVVGRLEEIDAHLTSASQSYDFARIQMVERNILRLAIFELLYESSIPAKVVIAEAVRLARKFSTPESASFVNAILDHLWKREGGG